MRVRRVVSAVVSVAVLGLTGCGGDEDSSSSAGPGEATATSSPEEGSSSTPSPSPEASEDEDAGVEPATGPVLEMESVSVRAPKGWRRNKVTSQLHSGSWGGRYVGLSEVGPIVPGSFDEMARSSQTSRIDVKKLDRTADVMIGGREWFTVEGWATGRGYYIVQHGIPLTDSLVLLSFTFPPSMSPAGRVKIMEPVMASLEWR